MRCKSGTPKAKVLPVPVRAWPITSVPVTASGMASAWIGNGWVTPTASKASAIAGETPRSRNVVSAISPLSPSARPAGQGLGLAADRRRGGTGGNGAVNVLLGGSLPGGASVARYAAVMSDAAPPAHVDLLGVLALAE